MDFDTLPVEIAPDPDEVTTGSGVGFVTTRTPQWPFHGALMVLNSGDLGYNRV